METTGDRIRAWRRRRGGMSQKALADLAGLSQGHISKIESGEKPLDRKSTQAAIALALDISVAQLLGNPSEKADPVRDRALMHVPNIRTAVVELAAGERRRPARPQEVLRDLVRTVGELRNATDYSAAAPLLADLLLDLGGYGSDMAPELIEALSHARFTLKSLGAGDLAREAAQFGVHVAERYGDPAWLGQARYSLVQAFPSENAFVGARVTARAAQDLESQPSRAAQEVYGRLHLMSAMMSATAMRAEAAWNHLAEAETVARALGEPIRYGHLSAGMTASWFGPTQVEYWRADIGAELGDPGVVFAVRKRIDLTAVPVPNRWVYYWSDVARAYAADGRHDHQAMRALAEAERSAPQHFRCNAATRDLAASLLMRARRRAVPAEFTRLIRSLGLDMI